MAKQGFRTMNDIDLLVNMNDLEKTASRLRDLGYFAETEVTDIGAWCEMSRHLPRMFRPPPAPGIEIHWTLAEPARFRNLATAGLWARSRPATIAGVEARVLSPEDLLLHLCLHAASDGNQPFCSGLRPLCDIAATAHCCRKEIAWQQIQSRAIEWQADRCVYLALWLAKELLAAGIPDSVLESLRPKDFGDRWAALAVNQVVLGGVERLSPEAELASGPLKALIGLCSPEPNRGRMGALLKALFPPRDCMAKYMAVRHGVPLNSVRNYSCYLTRAVDWLGKGARAAWQWGLRRPEVVADVRRFRQQTRLWNWLVGANAQGESAERNR